MVCWYCCLEFENRLCGRCRLIPSWGGICDIVCSLFPFPQSAHAMFVAEISLLSLMMVYIEKRMRVRLISAEVRNMSFIRSRVYKECSGWFFASAACFEASLSGILLLSIIVHPSLLQRVVCAQPSIALVSVFLIIHSIGWHKQRRIPFWCHWFWWTCLLRD